jgi:hypothetical protein
MYEEHEKNLQQTTIKQPFTTTVNYDYTEAFLLGLDLDAYFEYATDCIDTVVYFIDDTAYF